MKLDRVNSPDSYGTSREDGVGAILQACVEVLHKTTCLTLPLPYNSKYFFTGIVDWVSCICFQDLKHRLLQSQV